MTADDIRDVYLAREAIERAAAHRIIDGDRELTDRLLIAHMDDAAARPTAREPQKR